MNQIVLSSAFQRQVKKLVKQNLRLKNKIAEILKLLVKDVDHPSLKLHKLSGQNNWSISVTHNIRVIIHLEGNRVYCLRIGTHNQVY